MYDIGLPEFEILKRETNKDNDYIYTVVPKSKMNWCPECGSAKIVKHKKHNRMIRDLNEYEHRVGIIIQGHRYQCKECQSYFGEDFDAVDKSERLTKRLKIAIQKECFEKTFKVIAEQYGISQPSVKRVFDEYIEEISADYKAYAPQVLGIDEVHLHSQYCGVFVDVLGQRVIEMTEDRNKVTVKEFLAALPDNQKIECVTMDMWRPYKDAVRDVLGNVPIVIDKFHIVKELNKTLEDIRRTLRKDMEKGNRVSLKNMRFLLLTGNDNLSPRQLNQLKLLLNEYPQFNVPYQLKEAFRDIYLYCTTREEAEQAYNEWIKTCHDINCTAYDSFIDTVENWHTEIFNYFDYRYTNAQTESLNNVIRETDRAGRGYTFEILRAKILFRGSIAKKGKFNYKSD